MKKITYLALFCCLLFLQSCFEIIEQILVKNDGSGNFQLVVNMSKSRTKLNSIRKMKKINGHDVPTKEDISRKVADIEKTVKGTAGISNVKTSLDFDNYIASISCDFIKVTNLNAAIRNINVKEGNTKPIDNTYEYDPVGKTFSRLNKVLLNEEYRKMSNADKEVFASANYTSIFRFDNDIASFSNKDSKLSANKKAVMLKLNALAVMTSKKSIENKINLVK